MTPPNFGRRGDARPAPPPLMKKFSRPASSPALPEAPAPSIEDELKAWKQGRSSSFPLKLLALTASLCFGIASFALPEAVNDWVQYPLYALSAASLYAGFRRKHGKSSKTAP